MVMVVDIRILAINFMLNRVSYFTRYRNDIYRDVYCKGTLVNDYERIKVHAHMCKYSQYILFYYHVPSHYFYQNQSNDNSCTVLVKHNRFDFQNFNQTC